MGRMFVFRNGMVAFFNGFVTLIILLIAPLGLAAVLICTLAIAFSSFTVGMAADRIARYLGEERLARIVPGEVEND